MLDLTRVQRELVEIKRDTTSGVSVEVPGDDICRLRGTVMGPVGTPYEGGIFSVDIFVPGKNAWVLPSPSDMELSNDNPLLAGNMH